jgi:hypothetical protein
VPGQGIKRIQNPSSGQIDVFIVDANGYVKHFWLDAVSGQWGDEIVASGALAGAAIEAAWVGNVCEFYTQTTNGRIINGWYDSNGWHVEIRG